MVRDIDFLVLGKGPDDGGHVFKGCWIGDDVFDRGPGDVGRCSSGVCGRMGGVEPRGASWE